MSAVYYSVDCNSVDLMLFNGILPKCQAKCQHTVYFPPIFELILTSAISEYDSGAKGWIVKPGNTD
jgi:hypothetical protein